MHKQYIATILIACASTIGCAQTVDKKRMDSLFNSLAAGQKAMGSLVVSKNGTIVYSKGIGYAAINEDGNITATKDTRYRIASISKMFTSVMVMQLVEEKKISLSTTLDAYFPQLPNAKTITIEQMLYHRSGLHNYITTTSWAKGGKTEDEMLDMIAKSKPDFAPDSMWQYSNTNFWLLGYIVERIDKKPYSKCLQDRITTKLHLKNTYYGSNVNVKNNESYSYHLEGTKWEQYPETDMDFLAGAGAVVSTPADMAIFIEALFAHKLVAEESLKTMLTIRDHQGIGIAPVPFYAHRGYGHTGHIDGYFSTLTYFPKDGLAIAYCSNGHVYPLNDILIGILSIYFHTPYAIPDFIHMPTDLDQFTGTYSSPSFPLKIKVSNLKNHLMAQATGQSAFPLENLGNNRFSYTVADIEMDFETDKKDVVFKQSGATYILTKE